MPASAQKIGRISPASLAFGAILLIAAAFAFVGLNASAFDVDELFTLYLVDHKGGLGETLNRALGDTHPPLYYFFLYGWTQLVGLAEWVVRLPSAMFAVAALAIFVLGLRKQFSLPALLFAAAVGALSTFFFEQSQNARDYPLALAASAGLVAAAAHLRDRLAAGKPAGAIALLFVAGLIASESHSYPLLQTGMVIGFAILFWTKSWPTRAALAGVGLAILAVNVAYFALLIHASKEDLHDLWFENSFRAVRRMIRGGLLGALSNGPEFAVLGLLGVLAVRWLRGRGTKPLGEEAAGASLTRMSGFVVLGVILSGITISFLVAPSLSDRNLLTCSSFFWIAFARLYDKTAGKWRGRSALVGVSIVALLLAANLPLLSGRFLPRNEEWRVSAKYVQALPGCPNAEIPVVQPFIFGPPNQHFRDMAKRQFFGRYYRGGEGLTPWTPSEFAGRAPAPELMQTLAQRVADIGKPGACAVLAWGVHDLMEDDAVHIGQDLARLPGVAPNRVVIQEIDSFHRKGPTWKPITEAFVFLLAPPLKPGESGLAPPAAPDVQLSPSEQRQVGDRIAIGLVSSAAGVDAPAYRLDTFQMQRWRRGQILGELFLTQQRFTCDPKVPARDRKAWPSLKLPGCSDRPVEDWSDHSPI